MSLLRLIWRRLDELQRRFGVRIALSVLAVIAVTAYFGAVATRGASLRRDSLAIQSALRDSNLERKDEAALQFAEQGTVTVGSRVLGDASLAREAKALFGTDGRLRNPAAAAGLLLRDRLPWWAPTFLLEQWDTTFLLGCIALAALLCTIWAGLSVWLVCTLVAATLACVPFWLAGSLGWIVSIAGIAVLSFSFVLLVRVASAALSRPAPVMAIAAETLREALRLRIAAFFIGVLLVVLPLLPLWIDAQAPLRYQVQTFLARATGLTFFLAACMTVFLSCASVAFEIRDRQIWQLMTKPVARIQYLAGKWFGVVVLNAIVLLIGGAATFVYIQYLRTRPAADPYDALAVGEEVLTARASEYPDYRRLSSEELRDLVERQIDNDPLLREEIARGERSEIDVKKELARKTQQDFLAQQRSIAPEQERTYVFRGLQAAKRLGDPLTLRYSFDIGRIDPHEIHGVIFKFKDGAFADRLFVPAQAHVLPIGAELIGDDGTLEVTIENVRLIEGPGGQYFKEPGKGTMLFQPDSLEVLYRVSGFEANFGRAMCVNLLKLAFLAMLGTCAATILSFPVACMLCFTVLAIGSMAPFLSISLADYTVQQDAPLLWRLFQHGVRGVAGAAEWLLRAFGEARPNARLVEGRVISWFDVLRTFAVIGLAWTGLTFIVGYAAFRRKELAVYSGQS